ncbi:hypothetical protein [Xanthomonas phage RTH11]|nr:hypothetical protein [Xanthomonas phage RTH11]
MCDKHDKQEDAVQIKWGSERYKEQYLNLLWAKYLTGWAVALVLGCGVVFFIHRAFTTDFSLANGIGMSVWMLGVLSLSFQQSFINSKVHRLERYFNFFDLRHKVRHQLFCKWWGHCAALHGLKDDLTHDS